jgi:hypothetical protein
MDKLEEYDNPDLKKIRVQYLIRNLIRDFNIKDIDEDFITGLVDKDEFITIEEISRRIVAKRRKGIINTFLDKEDE